MPKQDIKQGLQQAPSQKDPMKKVIDTDHSQAARCDVYPDDVVLNRNSGSQDSGYSGPNEIDRSNISFEHRSRDEK
jgi:hypothetical protein